MRKADFFQGNGIYFFNGNGEINFCLAWGDFLENPFEKGERFFKLFFV